MSKLIEATCQGGNVTADGVVVDSPQIISEGQGQSSGFILIENGKVIYVTSNASDLKTTLEKVVSSLNKIGTILTAIGAGMTGPTTAPPPTLATDVAEVTALAAELETLKGALK